MLRVYRVTVPVAVYVEDIGPGSAINKAVDLALPDERTHRPLAAECRVEDLGEVKFDPVTGRRL